MDSSTFKRAASLVCISAVALGLDQLSKYWLLYQVGMIDRPPIVLSPFFSLVMVWNKGISFGILSRSGAAWGPVVLTGMAIVISLVLARLALRTDLSGERVGYGLIIGGALGNMLDRVRLGAVADFFYLHLGELGWPAFNVADSAIFAGVCILLLVMLKNPRMAA